MGKVWMIRHGKPSSTWGDHDPDPGLDDAGKAQADLARDRLLALPEPPKFVVSSPLRRCRETALPTARALGVDLLILPEVGEIPTPSALAESERPAWLQNAFMGRWSDIRGDLDYVEWTRSVASAVARQEMTAVFSHFVAINAAVSVASGTAEVLNFRPDHASITHFQTDGARLSLLERGAEASTGVL